jgi:hypothetical protein
MGYTIKYQMNSVHILCIYGAEIFETIIVAKLVKEFPAFYETRRFTVVFKTARHWLLHHTR